MATETNILHVENNHIRTYTGVKKFHDAGYYGQRVVAGTGENWDINNYNPDDLILIPFGNGIGWGNYSGGHGTKTAATFFQVAPQTKLVQLSKINSARTGKNCYCGLELYCIDYIKEYNITSIFCSFEMICDKYLAEKYSSVIDSLEYFNMFLSAGNDASSDYVELAMCDAINTVGAYYVSGSRAYIEDFTSQTSYVDFGAPDKQTVKFAKETGVIEYGKQSGTSFSAPWLCGMSCLINDFFIDKTGKPLHYKKMRQFLEDYSVDIGKDGIDSQVGYGAVILPNPSEIPIDKYVESEVDTPLITIDTITTNTTKSTFDVIKIDEYDVVCEKIPYTSIEKIDFDKCQEPTETLQSYYDRQDIKPDILINGGLFNLSTGQNVMSFINEGVEQNYKNNFVGVGIKYDNLYRLTKGIDNEANWKDFITAFPVLIDNGQKTAKDTWGNAIDINYEAQRQIIGYDDNYVYIVTISNSVVLETAQEILMTIGVKYAFNLDGGGSTRTVVFGETVNKPTENRKIDNIISIYLKEKEKPTVDVPDIQMGDYIVIKTTELKAGVYDESKVIDIMNVGDEVEITAVLQYNNNVYVSCKYNYQYGFCIFNDNLVLKDEYIPDEPNPEELNVDEILSPFEDKDMISDWAKEDVAFCIYKNIMHGSNNKFRPKDYITREEVCAVIHRMLEGSVE